MPMTRAKATALLNQREMSLYDDSRANPVRRFDEKALGARITRARAARDRARDLVRRQKLSSRERTGSKRGTSGQANQRSKDKADLLADILGRFETRLKDVERTAKAAARTGKPTAVATRGAKAAGRAPAKKSTGSTVGRTAKKAAKAAPAAAKKATAKTAKKATGRTAKKTAPAASAARRTAQSATSPRAGQRRKVAAGDRSGASADSAPAARKPRRLTPEQALRKTRKLLEAKQERDREPKSWETIPAGAPQVERAGFQSGSAARSAERLHAGQSRLPAIMGSISTRDRINQGRRDHRGEGSED